MTTTSEFRAAAAQRRPKLRAARKPQIWKTTGAHPRGPDSRPQNAQKNYERYLALARTEAQHGDHIAAENYLQHAEHYYRSMHESRAMVRPTRGS
jgi:Domain of unknown function (DUF4167)